MVSAVSAEVQPRVLVGTLRRLSKATQPWWGSGKASRKGDLNLDLKNGESTRSIKVERGGEQYIPFSGAKENMAHLGLVFFKAGAEGALIIIILLLEHTHVLIIPYIVECVTALKAFSNQIFFQENFVENVHLIIICYF